MEESGELQSKAGGSDLERWGALSSSWTSLPGAELVPYFDLTFFSLGPE